MKEDVTVSKLQGPSLGLCGEGTTVSFRLVTMLV